MALIDDKLGHEKQHHKNTKPAAMDGYIFYEEIEALKPILPPLLRTPMQLLAWLS